MDWRATFNSGVFKKPFYFGGLLGFCFTLTLFGLFCPGCKEQPSDLNSNAVVLQHRLRARVQTLDPAEVRDTIGTSVASDIFETLYDYHYLKRPYELIPILAAAMPTVSEDGKTYTIPIRRDAYYHDDVCFPEGRGRLLTAHDFVYAWKRIADVKNASVSWWIFDRRIVGLDEFREYSKSCEKGKVDYNRPVEGLQATDDFTLQVKLNRPWPQFIYWLAYIATAPMAQEAVEFYKQEIGFHPVGTGPFRVDRWESGAYVQASRHVRYHSDLYPQAGEPADAQAGFLADAGKQMPFAEKIVWRIVPEDQPRWSLFMKGFIDLTAAAKDNFAQVFVGPQLAQKMVERRIQLTEFDEPSTFWIAFNMKLPRLADNKPLRQAISCCIDRQEFIDIFWDGRARQAFGYIPPIMPGYDPNIVSISNSKYDLPAAKEHLKEAQSIAGGKIQRLRLMLGGVDSSYRQMGQFFARSLASIGLHTEIELYDWPTFLEKMRKGDYELLLAGWTADYPDVESFMQVFYGKNAPYPNEFSYINPRFDAIFERISTMPDSPERTALYRQAQRIVNDDLPCTFIYHRKSFILSHDWLGNVKPNSYKNEMAGWGMSKYYRLDPQKREQYKQEFR